MGQPFRKLFNFGKFFNYSYLAKIMTRKPKIGNLTNVTKLYPFLRVKKSGMCYLRGISW